MADIFKEVGTQTELKHFTRVIPRQEWGALNSLEAIPNLNPPIEKVHISFHRNWPHCTNQEDCSRVLRRMQLREMNERGLPDIRHNFMIGHDCNVYEGRGWFFKPVPVSRRPPVDKARSQVMQEHYAELGGDPPPPLPPDTLDEWDDKAIDIGFFSEDPKLDWPFGNMYEIAKEFVDYGVEHNFIKKDYTVL